MKAMNPLIGCKKRLLTAFNFYSFSEFSIELFRYLGYQEYYYGSVDMFPHNKIDPYK